MCFCQSLVDIYHKLIKSRANSIATDRARREFKLGAWASTLGGKGNAPSPLEFETEDLHTVIFNVNISSEVN